MKINSNKIIKSVFLFLIACFALHTVQAQAEGSNRDNEKTNLVSNLLNSKNFVFKAQFALPMAGRSIQLTSDYDVQVKGDTVQAFLPYFGRAFSAPMNPNESGIQFTSTRFDYQQTASKKKKQSWNITIQPKDAQDVRQLTFRVFENGSATLQVVSNNRQTISYNGYITERRARK